MIAYELCRSDAPTWPSAWASLIDFKTMFAAIQTSLPDIFEIGQAGECRKCREDMRPGLSDGLAGDPRSCLDNESLRICKPWRHSHLGRIWGVVCFPFVVIGAIRHVASSLKNCK
ncbi:hypothetical protein BDW60DRAFT_192510 [Aspergillus nidulans var. acristatus]